MAESLVGKSRQVRQSGAARVCVPSAQTRERAQGWANPGMPQEEAAAW